MGTSDLVMSYKNLKELSAQGDTDLGYLQVSTSTSGLEAQLDSLAGVVLNHRGLDSPL